jgi:hypothetical protein
MLDVGWKRGKEEGAVFNVECWILNGGKGSEAEDAEGAAGGRDF